MLRTLTNEGPVNPPPLGVSSASRKQIKNANIAMQKNDILFMIIILIFKIVKMKLVKKNGIVNGIDIV
jgi:hypothetical protein